MSLSSPFIERPVATTLLLIAATMAGGIAYFQLPVAPLPQIDLVPTGGVSLATVGDFIGAGASAVGAGADLVNVSKTRDGNSGAVSESARKYLSAIRAAREAMRGYQAS